MRKLTTIFILGIILCMTSKNAIAGQQKTNKVTIAAILSSVRNNWKNSLHQKQLNKAMDLYADNAVFFDPGGNTIIGKTQIRNLFAKVMKAYNSDIRLTNHNLDISGDLAYDSGDYQESLTDNATKKVMHITGSYLMVLKYDGSGKWQIIQHMWTRK